MIINTTILTVGMVPMEWSSHYHYNSTILIIENFDKCFQYMMGTSTAELMQGSVPPFGS